VIATLALCASFDVALFFRACSQELPQLYDGLVDYTVRLPDSLFSPYHTREYCKRKGLKHLTTAEAAAELIRQLPLPEEAAEQFETPGGIAKLKRLIRGSFAPEYRAAA